MATTNAERVGKALDCLKAGLMPYVEREMSTAYGEKWQETVNKQFPPDGKHGKKDYWDALRLLNVMWKNWDAVFGKTLGHAERSLVSELIDVRTKWAHQEAFSTNDAHRALDSCARLLNSVSASKEYESVEKMRMDLMRVQFEEQRRTEMRRSSFQPTHGTPSPGLKPWREVVTPHPDVASGRYQQAEFAADLWQVYLGEAAKEYQDPVEFYKRTYITEGLKDLLKLGLLRLYNNEGDPVVELQTNFGGGKTHSMLALYHLFSGVPATELAGVENILQETGCLIPANVHKAIIVGTKISPGRPQKKPDGTIVRTLWGEIAWQLGGKAGYEMIREDDENATNPGDRMKELFNKYSPCLILIDEWVAYARQLHAGSNLPAGSFDTHFTFAQTLSESAKAAKKTMLVVSIPASDNEIGGEWGKEALSRLKNAIGRVESPWRPASSDEGFEIVRRRLFLPLTNEQAVHRDAVARSFVTWYGANHNEFPPMCRESTYEKRIKQAYPIHPELFDRLYTDWSSLDKFQRTRGVLRLMAAVIHCLWERQDSNLLIMPGNIPIDDPAVQREITRYLDDQWVPVIEKDVDGPHALPLFIDRDNPTIGRYSACRRIARTIYIGSAPTIRAANRGIDDRRIKLGCVQTGEQVATFGDALRRLTDRATYLYADGSRYWYSTMPNVTRLAEDRAAQITDDLAREEVRKRLHVQARKRGDFSRVHACAKSSDIPDEKDTRLIILDPSFPHSSKNPTSAARRESEEILMSRGSSPRSYRNTLVFLAPDQNRVRELESAVKLYLAWDSIVRDKATLVLDPYQTRQAETKLDESNKTIEARIPEVYQWLLVPCQSDPKGTIDWQEIRLQGQDDLAVRASKKLKSDGFLMVQMAGGLLRHEMDKIPLWRGNSVSIRQLIDDFATYLYLPKVCNEGVIYRAIRSGLLMVNWQDDSFGYAECYNEQDNRYVGLVAGTVPTSIDSNGSLVNGLLVKPDIAAAQIESDRVRQKLHVGGGDVTPPVNPPIVDPVPPVPPAPELYHRFYGKISIDPIRTSRDMEKITNEVIQLLTREVGSTVEITLEINASFKKGADEKLQRDVTENCRTLKFSICEFEKN